MINLFDIERWLITILPPFALQRNYINQKNQRKKCFYRELALFVETIYIRKWF